MPNSGANHETESGLSPYNSLSARNQIAVKVVGIPRVHIEYKISERKRKKPR